MPVFAGSRPAPRLGACAAVCAEIEPRRTSGRGLSPRPGGVVAVRRARRCLTVTKTRGRTHATSRRSVRARGRRTLAKTRLVLVSWPAAVRARPVRATLCATSAAMCKDTIATQAKSCKRWSHRSTSACARGTYQAAVAFRHAVDNATRPRPCAVCARLTPVALRELPPPARRVQRDAPPVASDAPSASEPATRDVQKSRSITRQDTTCLDLSFRIDMSKTRRFTVKFSKDDEWQRRHLPSICYLLARRKQVTKHSANIAACISSDSTTTSAGVV